jgi:hypothetical protein
MSPEDALRRTFKDGNYYNGPVSALIERHAFVSKQLAVLEGMPGKMASHRAAEKRRMKVKFEKAIRSRLSWHQREIQKALDAGFDPSEFFEPAQRTFMMGSRARA